MIPRVRAAIATAILVGSATGAGAFTLLSPPASAPSGGFFECAIYNHSPSSGMQVTITILDELGLEVPSKDPVCFGARSSFCFRRAELGGNATAVACRFDVTQVGKRDVRAALRTRDAAFGPFQTVEAR